MKKTIKNLAAFEKLLGACHAHGASYNPGSASIERTALTALFAEAQKSIDAVHKAQGDLTKAINMRAHAFDALPLLGTKVVSIAAAHEMELEHVKDLNKIRKRLRSNPFKSVATKTSADNPGQGAIVEPTPETPVRKNRTLSFEVLAETFAEMIQFLESEASYNPKEPELTTAGLKETLANLYAQNAAINAAREALRTARAYRSKMIFAATGLHGIGMRVKKYFKAIFGATSEAYLPIHKIRFVTK